MHGVEAWTGQLLRALRARWQIVLVRNYGEWANQHLPAALRNGEATGEPQRALTFPFAIREDFAGNASNISEALSVMVYAHPNGHDDLYFLSQH